MTVELDGVQSVGDVMELEHAWPHRSMIAKVYQLQVTGRPIDGLVNLVKDRRVVKVKEGALDYLMPPLRKGDFVRLGDSFHQVE